MKRLTVKRRTSGGKDSRNRPVASWETLDGYLKAHTISPLDSKESELMNLSSATESFNIVVKGSTDLTVQDIVEFQGHDFNIISIKRFTEGHNGLRITVVTISRSGGAND